MSFKKLLVGGAGRLSSKSLLKLILFALLTDSFTTELIIFFYDYLLSLLLSDCLLIILKITEGVIQHIAKSATIDRLIRFASN